MITAVRTLGDLRAHGMALNARCSACGHRRDLNTDDLIKKLGADWVFTGDALDRRCGVPNAITWAPAFRFTFWEVRSKSTRGVK